MLDNVGYIIKILIFVAMANNLRNWLSRGAQERYHGLPCNGVDIPRGLGADFDIVSLRILNWEKIMA